MSDASVTPEPSMDEILQKIQRIIAEDDKPESAPAPTPPRSAEILTLTEAVGEGGTVRRLTPVETSPEPTVEHPPPPERRLQARTLEDLVRELLRPMLQGWLDQKMPDIIERLVKAELARALNEAGVH